MSTSSFSKFSLISPVLKAIEALGYEIPTPVQLQTIPILQKGEDLLAQAQTGTGKTAAFALPLLSKLDLSIKAPQALILAPTRELAIQVADNLQAYAKHMTGFKAVAIYGGQDFNPQLSALKRGAHVVVGTPGRLMDHLRRGTLKLDAVTTLVLDEADEMLKMGFIDDVEWILSHITKPHQTALFSATMPSPIVKMAQKYLKNPKRVEIKAEKNDVETIAQYYVPVSRDQKLLVLMRFLAMEENQGVIIFARTKNDTTALAEKLQAQGYKAAALNGDMSQGAREKTIQRLKNGMLNIVVATDVAARGLDVKRITHVFNYDMPFDVDSYVHRIGRTGRAGREGKAILFVTPREMRLVSALERHTNRVIKRITPPDQNAIQQKRVDALEESIVSALTKHREKVDVYIEAIKKISHTAKCSGKDIAAALLFLNNKDSAFEDNYQEPSERNYRDATRGRGDQRDNRGHRDRDRDQRTSRPARSGEGKKRFSSDERPPRKRSEGFSHRSDDGDAPKRKPFKKKVKK